MGLRHDQFETGFVKLKRTMLRRSTGELTIVRSGIKDDGTYYRAECSHVGLKHFSFLFPSGHQSRVEQNTVPCATMSVDSIM